MFRTVSLFIVRSFIAEGDKWTELLNCCSHSTVTQGTHFANLHVLDLLEHCRKSGTRAYRKLINQYHPNKLVSRRLSPGKMEVAKQKVQKIQAAYDLI